MLVCNIQGNVSVELRMISMVRLTIAIWFVLEIMHRYVVEHGQTLYTKWVSVSSDAPYIVLWHSNAQILTFYLLLWMHCCLHNIWFLLQAYYVLL